MSFCLPDLLSPESALSLSQYCFWSVRSGHLPKESSFRVVGFLCMPIFLMVLAGEGVLTGTIAKDIPFFGDGFLDMLGV
jgi:hypothetical protein